MVDNTSI